MPESATALPAGLRAKLAIAIDTDDLVAAGRLARAVHPYFGVAKVGLELFSASGPDAVVSMVDLGFEVFLDVKLHDIPTTVRRAARVLGELGARYLTLHAQGGVSMLRAGVEGLAEGAAGSGLEPPVALAVTVLTSDGTAPPHIMPKRVEYALEAGCGGVVVSAADVRQAKQIAPRLVAVTPGIRAEGGGADDHARASTPAAALAAGSDLLVIGRAVTASPDPARAASELLSGLA